MIWASEAGAIQMPKIKRNEEEYHIHDVVKA